MSGSKPSVEDGASGRFLHPMWVLFAILVVGLPMMKMMWPERDPPEVYAQIPSFSLIDQEGAEISRDDLLGTVWITDFIFTRCPNICPTLSARMQALQPKVLETEGIGLLSVSVDPEYDTPEVLTAYAERMGAERSVWRWVTGDKDRVHATVEGFQQALDVRKTPDNPVPDITHSTRLILVDSRGVLRGFYETDPENMSALWADALWLSQNPNQ